jgi:hypothetical protein
MKPIRWLIFKGWSLKKSKVNAENTTIVITSWITFSCHNEKGPPLSTKPILLAGTWKRYSKNAIPQLIRIIKNKPAPGSQFSCFIFKCPYQASVINALEQISNTIVRIIFFMKENNNLGLKYYARYN